MKIRSMKIFDLVLNIDQKRKRDGVSTRRGRDWSSKYITTARISSRGGGEGGVNSKAKKGKRRVTVNSLIIGVTFREIELSELGTSMGTLSLMAILNRLGQLTATCL